MEDKKQVILNQLSAKKVGRSAGEAIGAVGGLIIGAFMVMSGPVGWAAIGTMMAAASVGAAIGGIIDPPKVADMGDMSNSPTYSFGALKHTVTNQLPLPIIYGHVKVAGNVIWQSEPGNTIDRIQVIGEGEIAGIYNVRVNDLAFGEEGAVVKETLIAVPGPAGEGGGFFTQHDAISNFVLYGQNDVTINSDYYTFDYGANKVNWVSWIASILAATQGGGGGFKGSYTSIGLSGCTLDAYVGTPDQTVDARASGYIDGLKRCAYIAYTLTISDKLKGGNPVVTCEVLGLKIRQWDSSNNIFKTYREYSQNPAACLRDFLTNTIYGCSIPESWIDETSFGSVSEYCDALIDDGEGGTETRFKLDYIMDTRRPALDTINDILATFGGFLSVTGETIKLRVESANEIAAQAFDMDNIVGGSFGYSKFSKDDLPNKVMIQYVDPDQEWVKVYAMAEDKVDQDNREDLQLGRSVIEKKLGLLGITRFSQASRMAKRYLYMAEFCSTLCTFKVGIDSVFCEPGDIISVTHDVPGWTAKLFRILAVEEDEKDVISLSCREYNSSIYDDTFGSVIQKIDYGTVANQFAPITDVTSLTATENGYTDTDGTYIPEIDVAWAAPTDESKELLSSYIIEMNKDAGGYEQVAVASVDKTSYKIWPVEGGSTYYIKVKTVSMEGIISDGTISAELSVTGQDVAPATVSTFTNTFTNEIVFNWAANSERDVINYEIRIADANWGTKNANFVWSGDATTYTVVTPSARSGVTYYIKAKNRSGLYSTNADDTAPTNAAPAKPDVTAFSYYGEYLLDWTDSEDTDLLYYEIYVSETNAWGGEETLFKRISGTSAMVRGRNPISGIVDSATNDTCVDATLIGYGDDYFNGDLVRIVGGVGLGQERTILDFTDATGTVQTTANWTTNPDASSKYKIINRLYYKVAGVDTFGIGTLSDADTATFDPLAGGLVDGSVIDAIVAPQGGDYTDVQSAIDDGKRDIFVRPGNYVISADIVVPTECRITGEDRESVIIDSNSSNFHFLSEGSSITTDGTIAATNGDATITGTNTEFSTDSVLPGDIIMFRKGEYHEILSVTDDTHLELTQDYKGTAFSAWSCIIQRPNKNVKIKSLTCIDGGSYLLDLSIMLDCVIENCRFTNSDDGNRISSFYRSTFKNNIITGGAHGLLYGACHDSLVEGNTFEQSSNWGMWMTLTSYRVIIKGNTFSSNGVDGIYLSSSEDVYISNNSFLSNSNYGMLIKDGPVTISENLVQYNGDDGIHVDSVSDVTISKNEILNNGDHGICVGLDSGAERIKIIDNRIFTNGDDGCFCKIMDHSIVSENVCYDNGTNGIHLDDFCDDCAVADNHTYDNSNNGIQIDGDDLTVIGNVSTGNSAQDIDDNSTNSEVAHNVT